MGEHLTHARKSLLDVIVGRHPVADRHSHYSHTMPRRDTEPGNTACLYLPYDIVGGTVVITVIGQKSYQPLIDNRRGHDLGTRKRSYALD
jgi:hypothetical protein